MSVDVGRAVAYLDLDTSSYKKGIQSALGDLKTFKNQSATAGDKLQGLQSAMKTAGSALTKNVTVPIVGVGTAMVTTTAKFEAGMSEVAAISGAAGEELEALSNKAKEMGAKTKFSASESASALKYMAMAGWDTNQMLSGLDGVMNLAAASGEDLATTSDIVTDALTAFGLEAEDSAHFADILAKASSKSNTNVGLMGETFKYVAPVAGALGYSTEDAAIAIGLMANAGIKGSQAGTSLRSSLSRLAKPTKQVQQGLDDLGISMTNQDGSMKSLKELMDELRVKMGNLSKAEQARYASLIFGQEAMSGMLAIVNASDESYKSLTEDIYNADGAAQQMAGTMNDNLKGQLTILKSTIEGIAIQFGEIMIPIVKKVIGILQKAATWISNLSDEQKELITKIIAIAAVIGPVLLVVSKLIGVISTVKTALTVIGPIIGALASPIGIVIAVVAALALAWATNFGGIRDKTKEIMDKIKTKISTTVNTIKETWSTAWNNVKEKVTGIFDGIKLAVTNFSTMFKEKWSSLWNSVKSVFSSKLESITSKFKNFKDKILGWVEAIIDKLKALGAKRQEALENTSKDSNDTGGLAYDGSHANGLRYVPYDGYIAQLHQGERVLTAAEAKAYNSGSSSGSIFNFTFNSPSEMNPAEARRQSLKAVNSILFNM